MLPSSGRPTAALASGRRVYALRFLPPGTEVTIDYSTTEANPYWTMACTCGMPNCRRHLRAIQFTFAKAPAAPMALVRAWRHARLPLFEPAALYPSPAGHYLG